MYEPVLPANVPRPLDHELLAWAAGFFDGEGSTIARTDARRPDYFQLDVSVPQSGRDGVPAVLIKFQTAMLGVGVIRPSHKDAMWKWSAGGRSTAEMSLALMWPWLGTVKQQQALSAFEVVASQWARTDRRPRRPRYAPPLAPHPRTSALNPSNRQFAWAAGFLDAEGYFGNPSGQARVDGTRSLRVRASASQHGTPDAPAEVLLRLRSLLGGRIERHGDVDDHKWVLEGIPQVDWLVEELRAWLGNTKLTQAAAALDAAEASRVRRDRTLRTPQSAR